MNLEPYSPTPSIQLPGLVSIRHGRGRKACIVHNVPFPQIASWLVRKNSRWLLHTPLEPLVEIFRVERYLNSLGHGANAGDGAESY